MRTYEVILYFIVPAAIWIFIAWLTRKAFEKKQRNPQTGFVLSLLAGLVPYVLTTAISTVSDVQALLWTHFFGFVLQIILLVIVQNRLPQGNWISEEEQVGGEARGDSVTVVLHITLLITGLFISSPIWIGLFASFKLPQDVTNFPPTLLPDIWTFENYVTAWTSVPLFRFFMNSVIQTGIIVLFQVVFSILAAYAFAILDFPGRNLMFYLILGSLMVPFQLTFIPNFVMVSNWGLANTHAGLVVPFLASAFGVFLLRQFFMTIPRDFFDAAKVDGASSFRYLWQIVVPLSKGAISAFATFSFLSAWSQYLWPLIITNSEEMRTIQIGIRFFLFDQERGADWGAIMAVAVIALLPTLLIFLVAQRQLVKGIASTGLKG
ncbi:MAG: carbohydrate ABC transporter permease [Anaerolineae bacterium]|nr:carbohydrate ABC transporter permease [Anaerolineae bacterium]